MMSSSACERFQTEHTVTERRRGGDSRGNCDSFNISKVLEVKLIHFCLFKFSQKLYSVHVLNLVQEESQKHVLCYASVMLLGMVKAKVKHSNQTKYCQ